MSRPEFNIDKTEERSLTAFYKGLEEREEPCDNGGTIRVFERPDGYVLFGVDARYVAERVYRTLTALKTTDLKQEYVTIATSGFQNFLRDALLNYGLKVEIYGKVDGKWRMTSWELNTNPVAIAVKTQGDTVGLAFVDLNNHVLGVSEFEDNECMSNLESLLIQLDVKECITSDDKVKAVIERAGVSRTDAKSSWFNANEVESNLDNLLAEKLQPTSPELSLKNALGSLACLIKYLSLTSDASNHGAFTIKTHTLSQYMKLDASALKALHLMPSVKDSTKSSSLYGLLNVCKTATGSRTLAQWVKQPLMDKQEIEKRHEIVEIFTSSDLLELTRKFMRQAASLEDVVRVYQMVATLPHIASGLRAAQSELLEETFLTQLDSIITGLQKFEELVESTIDLNSIDSHEFMINPDMEEGLNDTKARLEACQDRMKDIFASVSDELGMEMDKKLKFENHHVHGWSFRLTRTDASCLRGLSKFKELATLKADLSQEYKKIQARLAKEIIEIACSYCPLLERCSAVLGQLDCILTASRHPCLEAQDTFIPNDVHLGQDGKKFLVITGPNMGGKSTLSVKAEISIFDCILARVGAGDSQLKGLSTFMSEMLETSAILKSATDKSLIIIDELGRGTSTYDGFGLAWAISEHIVKMNCFSMFATHFHELTELAKEHPDRVDNLHVAAHVGESSDDITLLYKVVPGVSSKSYGTHVAEVVKFPTKVVNMAKRKAQELDDVNSGTQGKNTLLRIWLPEISFLRRF
ncbi:DNA mismatch repair protein MSH2 [Yarrowia lipolytica]|nr:DNA mismatch repair protein MSH2 [Yarrowia lipolytica]